MKKLLLSIIPLYTTVCVFATTYYVSPSGNDATGTGTQSKPWKTLFKATSMVINPGDLIQLVKGTFLETQQSTLALGVSVEGVDSSNTILRNTNKSAYTEMIAMHSPEGTNGNQHISNLQFDGQNLSSSWGIYVAGRSNVSVYNCSFKNFLDRAVTFAGRIDNNGGAPAIYSTGNSFYNNRVFNCSNFGAYGGSFASGSLQIGGQKTMSIRNNIMVENARLIGKQGYPIKYNNDGYLSGITFSNNQFTRGKGAPYDADWCFGVELWNAWGGIEFANNVFYNCGIDLDHTWKNGYAYGAWVHHNSFTYASIGGNVNQVPVTIEFSTDGAIVEYDTAINCNRFVSFTPRLGDSIKNISIQKNLATNIGAGYFGGDFVHMFTSGGGMKGLKVDSVNISNNTLIADTSGNYPVGFGIQLPSTNGGSLNHINIVNNIMTGLTNATIYHDASGGSYNVPIQNLTVQYNDFYGSVIYNNNTDKFAPVFAGLNPGLNYSYSNNLNITPAYGPNYTLPAGSPLIGAGLNGTDIGYTGGGVTKPPIDTVPKPPVKVLLYTIQYFSDGSFIKTP